MSSNLVFTDEKYFEQRGSIYTVYDQRQLPKGCSFVQDKVSRSFQGVIRGFHGDNETWKLISCLSGKVKLVTYDIDTDEKEVYFLDGDDPVATSVLVPPRTLNAHQCLSNNCIFYYKWSEFYTSAGEQWSVRYNDPGISPCWDTRYPPIISDRDKSSQSLQELKNNVAS